MEIDLALEDRVADVRLVDKGGHPAWDLGGPPGELAPARPSRWPPVAEQGPRATEISRLRGLDRLTSAPRPRIIPGEDGRQGFSEIERLMAVGLVTDCYVVPAR